MYDEEVERCGKLEDFIRSNRPTGHYVSDDQWYSCPKSEGGTTDPGAGDGCDCGLEDKQAKFDKVLSDGH